MPELPEVETIRRRLAEVLPGKQIRQVDLHSTRSFGGDSSLLVGRTITKVTRRAKVLQFEFDFEAALLTHLKMTGQLIYVAGESRVGGGHPTADWTQSLPSAHTRISYYFTDQTELHFNDMRLFGWMRLLSPAEVATEFAKYGPDINQPDLTVEYLAQQLQTRRVALKLALLNPTVVAGLGNIYVCDTLNLARLSPFRPANSLTIQEVERLFEAARAIIDRGIALNGTTFDGKYVTVDGLAGGYQNEALVYGRAGAACLNCGSTITKVQQAGRGTYYCGVCQK